jgi:hypothetical protein
MRRCSSGDGPRRTRSRDWITCRHARTGRNGPWPAAGVNPWAGAGRRPWQALRADCG